MTKYIFSFIALLGMSINSYSQDAITPRLGKDIQVKIIEINKTDIIYKKFDSLNGPTLTIPKSDVLMISYADGTKEVLFKQIKVAEKSKQTESTNDTVAIETRNESPAIITLKSGEDIQARVIEVNETAIVYKTLDSINDTTLNIQKSDVLMISYADGTKELIYKQNTVRNEVKETEDKNVISKTELKSDRIETVKISRAELRNKGMQDSKINYKGKKSGAVWTAVSSIVLTPIGGLIPAIGFSLTTPRERNLNFDDTELKKDPDYKKAYVRQARRTKAANVLVGYVVGSAVFFALIAI